MKQLSIFQTVLLAVFGALAVAGVLIFAFAIGGSTSTSLGPVQIWGTLDATAFSAVLQHLAENDPSLAQVTYIQKDPATFDSDVTKALASGTGPDLILISQDYAYKDSPEIVPIPPTAMSRTQFQNTFIDAANPFVSSSGALAIPLLADPLVLYWNKDLLASAGFSRPPAYWGELPAIAQKVNVQDSSGALSKSAIDLGTYSNVDHAKNILATLIMQAGGSITGFDSSGHLISTIVPKGSTASGAAQNALSFFTEFANPSLSTYSWSSAQPDAQQAFTAGDLALYIGYASEEPAILRGNSNLNFGESLLPQASSTTLLSSARVWGLAATRGSKNPSAAITVAAALATPANAAAFSTAFGIPSARRDVLSAAAAKGIPQQLVSSDDLCKGVDPAVCSAQVAETWVDPDPAATDGIFQAMIDNTTSGAMLVTEALQRADQQLSQLLNSTQPSS